MVRAGAVHAGLGRMTEALWVSHARSEGRRPIGKGSARSAPESAEPTDDIQLVVDDLLGEAGEKLTLLLLLARERCVDGPVQLRKGRTGAAPPLRTQHLRNSFLPFGWTAMDRYLVPFDQSDGLAYEFISTNM